MKEGKLTSYLKRVFFGTDFRRNATLLSSGNIVLLVLQTAFYPVVSRLYSNIAFGEFAIVQSCTYLLGFIVTLKYESGILSSTSIGDAEKVKTAILTWSILVCMGLLIFTLVLPSHYYDLFLMQKYLMLVPLFLMSFAVNQVFRHWLLRKNQVASFMKYLLVQKLSSILFTFLLAFVLTSYNGLILGHALGAMTFLILVFFKDHGAIRFDLYLCRQILMKHIGFLKFLLPSSVMYTGGTQMPFLLTNEWLGKSVTGSLSMAMQVVHLPQTVLFSKLSESLHQRFKGTSIDKKELLSYVTALWRKLFFIMFPPSLALFFFGEEIYTFILGEHWLLSGKMVVFLALPMFTAAFSGVVYNTFIIIERKGTLLLLQIMRLLIVVAVFALSGFFHDILLGVQLFSYVISGFHILVCVVVLRLLTRPHMYRAQHEGSTQATL